MTGPSQLRPTTTDANNEATNNACATRTPGPSLSLTVSSAALCHQPYHGYLRLLFETPEGEAEARLDIVSPLTACFVSFPFQAPSGSHPSNAMPQASLCSELRTQRRATKTASFRMPSARLVPREEDSTMAFVSREGPAMDIYIVRLLTTDTNIGTA